MSTPEGIGELAADMFLILAPSSKGFLGGEADAAIGRFLSDESGALKIPGEKPDLGAPGTLRNPDGTLKNAADQIDEITKYRNQGGLAEKINKSEDVLKNKLRGPYDPNEW